MLTRAGGAAIMAVRRGLVTRRVIVLLCHANSLSLEPVIVPFLDRLMIADRMPCCQWVQAW